MKGSKWLYALASFALAIGLWQLVIIVGDYPEALFPGPLAVLEKWWALVADGSLFVHIGVSLYRFIIGYGSAVIVAIIAGVLLGRLPRVWALIDPVVQVIRPVSPIAWSPFIVLWFGIGDMPAIVIIFIAAFFPVLLATVAAVNRIDPLYLKVASNFELSQKDLIWKIILPAAFPAIGSGLHMAIGSAWIFLVAGEMVGAQSGLGYLIVDARNALDLDTVLAAIVTIGVIGLALDHLLRIFENAIKKVWTGKTI